MRGDRSGENVGSGRTLLLGVFGILFCVLIALDGFAGERVVYVESDIYSSDLLVTTDFTEPVTVTLSDCGIGPRGSVTVSADETAIVERITDYQCDGPVGLFTPTYSGALLGTAKISTLVTFRDELGNLAAYEIPALRYSLEDAEVLEGEGIRNDDTYDTAVILFNEAQGLLYVTASVYDQDNELAGRETIEVPGRSHVLTNLATYVEAGRVELRFGISGIGCPGCEAAGPVYGFVTVNWREGGSPRVVPLEPMRYAFAIE